MYLHCEEQSSIVKVTFKQNRNKIGFSVFDITRRERTINHWMVKKQAKITDQMH